MEFLSSDTEQYPAADVLSSKISRGIIEGRSTHRTILFPNYLAIDKSYQTLVHAGLIEVWRCNEVEY